MPSLSLSAHPFSTLYREVSLALRRHGSAPFGEPPTAAETALDYCCRGSVDTMCAYLHAAHVHPSDEEVFPLMGGKKTLPSAAPADDAPVPATRKKKRVNRRFTWNFPAYGIRITQGHGVTVQVEVPVIAFGRNDRQADVDHGALALLFDLITTKLLPETTRVAGEKKDWQCKRGRRVAGKWRLTRLDCAMHVWFEREEQMTAVMRALRWVNSARSRKSTRTLYDEDDVDAITTVNFTSARRSPVRNTAYDKGRQQRKDGMPGMTPLPVGRVLRIEVSIASARGMRLMSRAFEERRDGLPVQDADGVIRRRCFPEQACLCVVNAQLMALALSAVRFRRNADRHHPVAERRHVRACWELSRVDAAQRPTIGTAGKSTRGCAVMVQERIRAFAFREALRRAGLSWRGLVALAFPDGPPPSPLPSLPLVAAASKRWRWRRPRRASA